jgi:hypothetical protein
MINSENSKKLEQAFSLMSEVFCSEDFDSMENVPESIYKTMDNALDELSVVITEVCQ